MPLMIGPLFTAEPLLSPSSPSSCTSPPSPGITSNPGVTTYWTILAKSLSPLSLSVGQIPHVKIGPEETPRLPYLRFASVTLYPSNEDLSLAIGSILRSFSYPSASLVCAKAECEYTHCVLIALRRKPRGAAAAAAVHVGVNALGHVLTS